MASQPAKLSSASVQPQFIGSLIKGRGQTSYRAKSVPASAFQYRVCREALGQTALVCNCCFCQLHVCGANIFHLNADFSVQRGFFKVLVWPFSQPQPCSIIQAASQPHRNRSACLSNPIWLMHPHKAASPCPPPNHSMHTGSQGPCTLGCSHWPPLIKPLFNGLTSILTPANVEDTDLTRY